jgi:hypothetical protein
MVPRNEGKRWASKVARAKALRLVFCVFACYFLWPLTSGSSVVALSSASSIVYCFLRLRLVALDACLLVHALPGGCPTFALLHAGVADWSVEAAATGECGMGGGWWQSDQGVAFAVFYSMFT